MTRYDRQTCLPEIGSAGQARLAASRVLVAGAGGLGATLLPLLAGAGVGEIRVYDPDRVEESNLHRQILFRMTDLGRPKAQVAAEALTALNPDCRVTPVIARLGPDNAADEIADADLIFDAADAFATTYALSDLCRDIGKPLISASVLGRQGYVGGFCGAAPSIRAIFPDLPSNLQSCATAGVMGPAVATLGALQAQMGLSVLLDHRPSPLGQLVSLDMASWRMSGFRFDDAQEPLTAVPQVLGWGQITADDLLFDLRDAAELPSLTSAQVQRMPAASVAALNPPGDRRAVFVCASGLRAWRAARVLNDAGHARVAILADPREG
ncbi:HesA/MoeB/ThiF family protein [Paracoccus tegillarcae]|uniref:Thiamine biosynthesis protein ThiF n=1 Tax=Paracoccus tegillarcae TaxID=1529068 RepID=A0A2K9EJR5_9RHOB|nr:HesA/MoeB/ThiF family protein [Paracoccus tegillarcae]AUH35270.1 thiamine biosynthesis protein ThiF [Paracoccus tegillarcae]